MALGLGVSKLRICGVGLRFSAFGVLVKGQSFIGRAATQMKSLFFGGVWLYRKSAGMCNNWGPPYIQSSYQGLPKGTSWFWKLPCRALGL